jgi:hypothetical protein
MSSLSSLQSEVEIYQRLERSSRDLWGDERTQQLERALKAAGHQLYLLFQVPLGPRDEEPDFAETRSVAGE